jgi:serine acetyltransferase
MQNMKRTILSAWTMTAHLRGWIKTSKFLADRIPVLGKAMSMLLDRLLVIVYGVDVTSQNIFVVDLRIPHPVGVLLGGNGIRSDGTVVINSGVKFVGRSPKNVAYLERHAQKRVFELGHNVVIGANSVVVGPVTICDNVMIATMSLVNKDITEPGVYAGVPVRKISDMTTQEWI